MASDDSDPGSVVTEPGEHEPDEFDPDSLGPSPPDPPEPPSPGPDPPEPPTPSGAGMDSEVAALFWGLVLVFNVALLALAVGPMLAYFEGQVELGLQIFLGGVVAFAYGYYRYVQFRSDRDENSGGTGDRDHNG